MIPTRFGPGAIVRLVIGLLVLAIGVGAVGAYVREPITTFSAQMVADLGLGGVFLAVLALDQVPMMGFQPAVFLGYTGGVGIASLVVAAWAGSLVASMLFWVIGRSLRSNVAFITLLERWRVGGWLRDHGARAIAVAAVAPVPFGLATLGAGAMGVRFRDLVLGAAFRVVKIAAMVGAVALGWGAAG